MKRFFYRMSQFRRAYTDKPSIKDLERAKSALTPGLYRLFVRMQPFEQAHAIRVFDHLIRKGYTQPDLLAAALLHDVGKVRSPLKPWERAAAVLAKKVFSDSAGMIREGGKKWWNTGIVVADQHAAWGAEMTAQAGASPRTVELIARHQDEDLSALDENLREALSALQRADEEN